MVLKGKGTLSFSHKTSTGLLYIPADMTKDSAFPLEEGKVIVEIVGKKLVVTMPEGKNEAG